MKLVRGWEEGEDRSNCLIGTEFLFEMIFLKFPKMDSGNGCTIVWMHAIPLS
jgi:hypothetical protein